MRLSWLKPTARTARIALALTLALSSMNMVAGQKTVAPTKSASPATTSATGPNFVLPSSAPTSVAPAPGTGDGAGGGAGGAGNSTMTGCPLPLINNVKGLKIKTCIGPCCIKCPAIESFYEPDRIHNVMQSAYYVRQVSLGFSIFMALSYLVLPGKRAQPHISVLFLTVSLSLWYAAFDVMPGISNACKDEFEQSTSANSKLCGVQGVLIVYLTQTSALWCSLLIYKLHLLAVWRADFIDRYYRWFTAFCWILPMGFAIPMAVKGLSEYPGIGFSCIVSTENLNTYLFYPTAIYMYPAMVCHVVTVGKMIHLAVMSSKIDTGLSQLSTDARMKITTTMQAKRLLRGQWRPALMMGTVMTALTVFWLFYFVDAHRLASLDPDTEWLKNWFVCVAVSAKKGLSGPETQTVCARLIAKDMPSVPWFTAAEMLLAIIGVIVAMVFISKSEFWEEWAYLLSNLFRRGKTGNGSSRGRRSPDDGGSSSPTVVNTRHQDDSTRKHAGPAAGQSGRNMNMGGPQPNNQPGQWYDMDDLLDKESVQGGHQRSSFGSRAGMVKNLGPNPIYNSNNSIQTQLSRQVAPGNMDQRTGDLLYRPPNTLDATPTSHWTPSAHTLANPSRAYMEQPVVPSPVPRTPKMGNSQATFLSSPPQSPTYPKISSSGSLSPMPQKPMNSASVNSSRGMAMESVPIISVATRGSPAMAAFSTNSPTSPTSPNGRGYQQQQQRTALYNSNESADQIMMASRESVGSHQNNNNNNYQQQQYSNPMRINTQVPYHLDQRAKSPPPNVPTKSPARMNTPQPGSSSGGYMSPTY